MLHNIHIDNSVRDCISIICSPHLHSFCKLTFSCSSNRSLLCTPDCRCFQVGIHSLTNVIYTLLFHNLMVSIWYDVFVETINCFCVLICQNCCIAEIMLNCLHCSTKFSQRPFSPWHQKVTCNCIYIQVHVLQTSLGTPYSLCRIAISHREGRYFVKCFGVKDM